MKLPAIGRALFAIAVMGIGLLGWMAWDLRSRPAKTEEVPTRTKTTASLAAPSEVGTGATAATPTEDRSPSSESAAFDRDMAAHSLPEKDLRAKLARAGESAGQELEGLFTLQRRGASEDEMKAYARAHVRGIAARAFVFKWIDQQLGKPPIALPPPGPRNAMDLGKVEYKGSAQ
jgi:hypothetical protein